MEHFKARGLWFLDDDPKNRVAGTIRHSKKGLSLTLLGSFRGGWQPSTGTYPLIHGVVSKSPYGEFVTLIDCFTKQTSLTMAGIGSETIYCNRGIFGDTHLPPDHDQFEALDVRLSDLTEWFGRRGIVSERVPCDGDFGLNVRYRKPESVKYGINDQVLTLGMGAKSSESPETLSISEEAHFFIEPLPRLTAEQLFAEYVRPLQDLLSFATDRPNAVQDLEFRGEKVVHGRVEWSRKYHLLGKPIFQPSGRRDDAARHNMLFTYEEAQEAVPNIFEKWFDFKRKYEAFCTVYFALLYAPPTFLDEKFLRLMSAFTFVTSHFGDVSQRTTFLLDHIHTFSASMFTEEERAMIGHVLPTGPEIEMPFRLLMLLGDYQPLMSQIIGDNLSGFVRSVSDTLAFVERRIAEADRPPFQGEDLYYAIEKIRMLIKMIVLTELGFGGEQVSRIIGKNKQFIHIKGTVV
jgi:hypothetical protein